MKRTGSGRRATHEEAAAAEGPAEGPADASLRLADVFRQAPAFLAVLHGPDHRFAFVNDAYYALVGHRDLIGRTVADAVPEVRGQGFLALLDGVLATGEPLVGRETPIRLQRTPDGPPEERFVDFVYLALTEADGTRSGVVAHGSDVTAQVLARCEVERLLAESERARAEAEAARHEAEAANRAKGEFLSTMSHELRTPLNAIGGYAELLELGIRGPMTSQQVDDVRRIQQSQRHLLGLVNEVLDLAKADAGGLRVERAAVPVADTVDAALALVRPQAAAKGVALRDGCVGAEHPYLGDEPRVRQVLVNLLANAVKFTPPGGQVTVSCAVTDAPPPGAALVAGAPYVALRVTDTGVGIPDEARERIFEPFVQVDGGTNPYTRTGGGTGLGLTISRRLARLMGGDLTVDHALDHAPGTGSTFTLWLPAPERRAVPRATPAAPQEAVGRSGMDPAPEAAAGLARLGDALAGEAAAVVRTWATQLRADATIPTVGRTDHELEDHLATFATEIGLALRTLGDRGPERLHVLRDSRAILAVLGERHGAQRARLGWTEAAVARELALFAEALQAAVLRLVGATDGALAERARAALAQLLDQTERVSLGGFRLAAAGRPPAEAP